MGRLACLRPRLAPAQGKGWSDERRGSRHQRGYGTAWERSRKAALERDLHLCQPCLQRHRVSNARTVDHIVPKSEGGSDELANLQAICDECHRAKTQAEANRNRGGG